jgi:cystathionine beta-synthase
MYQNNVLETIGNTPLVRLHNLDNVPGKILAKVEAYNPGLSAKDRIVRFMVAKAEQAGKLKPGSTIVEATSGNTGFSLALICAIKGYKCILTLSSKASNEKVQQLKAMGAEVVICPADVAPEDPASYYSQAISLSNRLPNAYYLNQNYNTDNLEAHFLTTGPEIWKQCGGKITYFICCAGTGGTISGCGRFLKKKNPDVKVIAVDGNGSVLKKYHETGIYDRNAIKPILIEGLGKTIIPSNVDFSVIDEFVRVTDKDAALRVRELAKDEGLFVGYSSGAALQALYQLKDRLTDKDVVVLLLADHGSRYLSKIYNDLWMKEQGFLGEQDVVDDLLVQQHGVSSFSYKRFTKILRERYKSIKNNIQQRM